VNSQIMDGVIRAIKPANGWKVLVVDKAALKVISSCCKMSQMMDEGVAVIENLAISRQPMKHYEAIYLMAPTLENIEYLKKDFVKQRDVTTPKYGAAHVVFLDGAADNLIAAMNHPQVKPFLRCIKELNLSFLPKERRVYTAAGSGGLYNAYSPYTNGSEDMDVAKHVANVCAILGESPIVRYQGSSDSMKGLAALVQQRLDELRPYNDAMGAAAARKKSQVILLERGFDISSMVLHELTYQAASMDFCDIDENNVFKFPYTDGQNRQKTKEMILDENDDVWTEFKHKHIGLVADGVHKLFQKFQKETSGEAETKNKSAMKELSDLMKAMPQNKDKKEKLSLHISLADRVYKAITATVEKCAYAEQDMAMGEDKSGSKVRNFIQVLSDVIVEPNVSIDDRLRLLMVCIAAADGLKDSDLTRLFELAEIPVERRAAVYNLKHLGQQVTSSSKAKKPKRRTREYTVDVSRWTPILKDILEDAVTGQLSMADYPSVRDTPDIAKSSSGDAEPVQSGRNRGGWAKDKKKNKEKKGAAAASGPNAEGRVVVYIAGAVSYSEMRVAYEVSQETGWDILIGSGAIATPQQFLDSMQTLSEEPKQSTSSYLDVQAGAAAGGGGASRPEEGTLTFVKGTAVADRVHAI